MNWVRNGSSTTFEMGLIDLLTVYDAILAGGQTRPKITVNVCDFGLLGTALTPLQSGGFPQQKCILKDIYTETIFIKYKDEIQVITTVKESFNIMQITMKLEATWEDL